MRAVERAGGLLERCGHHVEDVDIPALDEPVDDGFGIVMCVAVARDLARWSARTGVELTPDDVEPSNLVLAQFGGRVTGAEYAGAIERMQLWSRGVAAWWNDYDLLVTPTSPEPPVPLGELAPGVQDPGVADRMGRLVSFTSPFDITGQPAISLPLHWTIDEESRRSTAASAAHSEANPTIEKESRRSTAASAAHSEANPTIEEESRRSTAASAAHSEANPTVEHTLPIGVQLTAAYGREDVLLRVGAQLEEAAPWRDRHPPVSSR